MLPKRSSKVLVAEAPRKKLKNSQ